MTPVYYNEYDARTAAWLRELIACGHLPPGDVDTRDIRDVQPDDVRGYRQCHWFAGIGGWPLALQFAGWPASRSVWTGSPPCQSLSSAAHGRNTAPDEWIAFAYLIAQCLPCTVLGEQVTNRAWLSRAARHMEGVGYRFNALLLPAFAAGADHHRERAYFVCDTDRESQSERAEHAQVARMPRRGHEPGGDAVTHGLPASVVRRGADNAVYVPLAAAFVEAVMEVLP